MKVYKNSSVLDTFELVLKYWVKNDKKPVVIDCLKISQTLKKDKTVIYRNMTKLVAIGLLKKDPLGRYTVIEGAA